MRKAYPVQHWIFTLLLAPGVHYILRLIVGLDTFESLLDYYLLTLLVSIAFSLPTFFVYLVCFHFLKLYHTDVPKSKIILIGISVIGVVVTFYLMGGVTVNYDIILSYALTAMIIGSSLNLKPTPVNNSAHYQHHDNN